MHLQVVVASGVANPPCITYWSQVANTTMRRGVFVARVARNLFAMWLTRSTESSQPKQTWSGCRRYESEVTMSKLIPTPWNVVEADFPLSGTPSEQIHFLLNYAIVAPSRHNVQPWLFHIEDSTVELHADMSCALPVADPDNREMIISCGAALANFLIAARHFGLAPVVA